MEPVQGDERRTRQYPQAELDAMPRPWSQPAAAEEATSCPDVIIDSDGVWELVGPAGPGLCEYSFVMPFPLVIDSIPFG